MGVVAPKQIKVIGGKIYRAGQEYPNKIKETKKAVFEAADPAPEIKEEKEEKVTENKPKKEGAKK